MTVTTDATGHNVYISPRRSTLMDRARALWVAGYALHAAASDLERLPLNAPDADVEAIERRVVEAVRRVCGCRHPVR